MITTGSSFTFSLFFDDCLLFGVVIGVVIGVVSEISVDFDVVIGVTTFFPEFSSILEGIFDISCVFQHIYKTTKKK